MGSHLREDAGASGSPSGSGLSEADRILVLAARAWAAEGADGDSGAGRSRLRDRLEPSWVRRLGDAWERSSGAAGVADPARIRDQIGRAHRAEARVDPERVHPSWWVRALREESPAVQRVMAAAAPGPVRQAVQAGLLLDPHDLAGDRPGDPAVRAWVLALWAERLVGGEPERPDDPPAIIVLSRLTPRDGYRLCDLAGLAKHVLAGQQPADPARRRALRPRWEGLQPHLAAADRGFLELARRDIQSPPKNLPSRHRLARIGLLTLARLLAAAEPFRVRWALQHWPYPLAKLIRSLMPPVARSSAALGQGESLVLKTAWDRLNLEGRLPMAWPEVSRTEPRSGFPA